jgi:hypothetical protein
VKYLECDVRFRALDEHGRELGGLKTVRAATRELLEQRLAKVLDDFEQRVADALPPTPIRLPPGRAPGLDAEGRATWDIGRAVVQPCGTLWDPYRGFEPTAPSRTFRFKVHKQEKTEEA